MTPRCRVGQVNQTGTIVIHTTVSCSTDAMQDIPITHNAQQVNYQNII